MGNQRHRLTITDIDRAILDCSNKLYARIVEKGVGSFASNHEIFGIIKQETSEYENAIHQRASDSEKIEELLDIAVACLFGVASIKSGGIDW